MDVGRIPRTFRDELSFCMVVATLGLPCVACSSATVSIGSARLDETARRSATGLSVRDLEAQGVTGVEDSVFRLPVRKPKAHRFKSLDARIESAEQLISQWLTVPLTKGPDVAVTCRQRNQRASRRTPWLRG